MTIEYRLGAGTLSASTLNGSSSYLLENFAVQTDQVSNLITPWGPPKDDPTMWPRRARYRGPMADNSRVGDGGWMFDWILAYLTEGMVSYLESTFFASADYCLVTVKTLKAKGTFQVYNAMMWAPIPGVDYLPMDFGVQDYKLHFVGGTAIS